MLGGLIVFYQVSVECLFIDFVFFAVVIIDVAISYFVVVFVLVFIVISLLPLICISYEISSSFSSFIVFVVPVV